MVGRRRPLPLASLLLALPAFATGGYAAEGAATCAAGGSCGTGDAAAEAAGPRHLDDTGDRGHFWPRPRGRVGQPSVSPYVGPWNLTESLSWTWHHPEGRFHTVINGGPLIDERKNIYLTAIDAVRKFSPDGELLWAYAAPEHFANTASINEGSIYITDRSGIVIAIDMDTGYVRWKTTVGSAGGDISTVEAHSGIVMSAVEAGPMQKMGGACAVVALNASTGETLWRFRPDSQLWNFLPMFTNNGSFLFQDQIGGVYHLGLDDGRVIWKAGHKGGWQETWCDGGAVLGPNGLVYAVSAKGPIEHLAPNLPGDIRAYRLEDGRFVWSHEFSHPPNSWPVVGRLRGEARLSVILPIGAQGGMPLGLALELCGLATLMGLALGAVLRCLLGRWRRMRCWCCFGMALVGMAVSLALFRSQVFRDTRYQGQVWAFDAETGAVKWRWDPPMWVRHDSMGDAEGLVVRILNKVQPVCVPNPWASATMDANGSIYTGYMNGKVYVIRDSNGDSRVDSKVVDEYDTKAAFSHPGVAMAPGMLAIASCDTLFVFRH